jgi:hypothetical protein
MNDFNVGETFDLKFNTRTSAGAPITLAGTPAISIYLDNNATPLGPATVASPADGITLSIDFNSVTGYHNIRIVATVGNGYANGSSYSVIISAGTVDGVSVVGSEVGYFTLGRSAAAVSISTSRSEPGQGIPPVSTTFMEKIDYLYKMWRNKKDQSGSLSQLYADDASTVDQKATTSEAGGTVTHEEWESGP